LSSPLGILLIAAGAVFFLLALLSYRKTHSRLQREGFEVTPIWVMALVILFLLGGTFIALLLVLK
jgi:uncharacterized membrane protein YidH (DUF202 family)